MIDVLNLALQLLDLAGDLAELVLHRDDVLHRLGSLQKSEHRVALSFLVDEARLQVHVLGADVVAADVLALDLAHLGELIDRVVELGRRDHESDHAGPDLGIGRRVGLGVGAGDKASLQLNQSADVGELGVERARADGDRKLGLANDLRTLDGGDD